MEDPQQRGSFTSQAGLTISDMMMGLVLTGVLLFSASPAVSELLATYRLRAATHQIFGELQHARLAAVMQNNPYHFSVLAGTASYQIHDDLDGDYIEDAGEVSVRNVGKSGSGVQLSANDAVTFLANGTALSHALITVSNGRGDSRQIEVGAGGSIRIR